MNGFVERSLRRGVAALAAGKALPIKLLPEASGEKETPLMLSSGADMVSTWYRHPVPTLFAAGPSTPPADYFLIYPKGTFSGSCPEDPALKRGCATSRSVTGC
jgi:hypothetical protein